MRTPACYALPRHGRHHMLKCHHHGLESAGYLLIGSLQPPHAVPFRIEIVPEPIALLSELAQLLLQRCYGLIAFTVREDLLQKAFELIERGIEPLRSLLHSIRFGHRAAGPPRPACRLICRRSDTLAV